MVCCTSAASISSDEESEAKLGEEFSSHDEEDEASINLLDEYSTYQLVDSYSKQA